jgi:hypothetical protein
LQRNKGLFWKWGIYIKSQGNVNLPGRMIVH